MVGFIWRRLSGTMARAVALATGILVAAVSFSLLTAAVTTGQARTTATLQRNLRPAYDILVRSPRAASESGAVNNLVTDNYLSGIFGGITMAQYRKIAALPGVGVAAPIAMIGYVLATAWIPVDISKAVSQHGAQLFRFLVSQDTDRGLTRFPSQYEAYVYVTPRQVGNLLSPTAGQPVSVSPPPGTAVTGTVCNGGMPAANAATSAAAGNAAGNDTTGSQISDSCAPLSAGAEVDGYLEVSFPILLAAIDPAAEAKLDGLNAAVVEGTYLKQSQGVTNGTTKQGGTFRGIPVLVTTNPYIDDELRVSVQDASSAAGEIGAKAGTLTSAGIDAIVSKARGRTVQTDTITAHDAYQTLLGEMRLSVNGAPDCCLVDAYWTSSPVRYQALSPREVGLTPVRNPSSVWTSALMQGGQVAAPPDVSDVNFRTLTEHVAQAGSGGGTLSYLDLVGEFDPARLAAFGAGQLRVPLQTFNPPVATGATPGAQALLHDQSLWPNGNVAGYLQQTPMMLTTLNSVPAFAGPAFPDADMSAPISAIRIRVAGLHGTVRQRLNQIAAVAYQIKNATGLRVDITAGSSAVTTTVAVPAGKFGRPGLLLREDWVQEGASLMIVTATDRMSVLLLGLILVVTVLFLSNGVYASVRTSRHEIGVLRTAGWPRHTIFGLILGDTAIVGALAGLAGTAIAGTLVAAFALRVPADRLLLVAPVATALAILAGTVPALSAARALPLDALRPVTRAPRRAVRVTGLGKLILVNVARAPGRAIVAILAVAIGACAIAVLLGIDTEFNAKVDTTVLGQLVVSRVRAVDYLSAGLTIVLGAACVADVVIIGMRERAPEFAALSALGWGRRELRLVTFGEGLVVGLAGSVLGAVLALALGSGPLACVLGAAIGLAAVLASSAAALLWLGRLPVTVLLGGDE